MDRIANSFFRIVEASFSFGARRRERACARTTRFVMYGKLLSECLSAAASRGRRDELRRKNIGADFLASDAINC
jgi:hypothetical protein